MLSQRHRAVAFAAAAILVIWGVAWAGFIFAKQSKPTAAKVRAYLHQVELAQLSGAARAEALNTLANKLNALPYEERRAARLDREWERWFEQMTEAEKAEFIERTLPTGFRQMLVAFEQLPEERRQRAIEESMKRLRQTAAENEPIARDENRPPRPPLSPELEQKAIQLGLRAFFSESSAQSKAELAPLLEELQHAMESGRMFRGR